MSGPSTPSADVDALFMLPLGEFIAARNALAARLEKAGRQAESNEAKALPKPSVSAWAVNQLYWHHRASFDRLVDAGERLRRVQAKQMTGSSARELVDARRAAIAELAAIAANILRDGNYGTTRDMLLRITRTLEALSTYGSLPGAPAAGRLSDDLDPPGFEAMSALLKGSGVIKPAARTPARTRALDAEPATKPVRGEEEKRKGLAAAAKAAVRDADRALRVARKRAERAAASLKAAAMRAKERDRQRAEIERRLVRAGADAEAAHRDANEAAANARVATDEAEAAERALELARQRLKQLAGDRGRVER